MAVLRDHNSLKPELMGPPLMKKIGQAIEDKHLGTYIAFEMCYQRLANLDLSNIKSQ